MISILIRIAFKNYKSYKEYTEIIFYFANNAKRPINN
jgi:hypothetical protein